MEASLAQSYKVHITVIKTLLIASGRSWHITARLLAQGSNTFQVRPLQSLMQMASTIMPQLDRIVRITLVKLTVLESQWQTIWWVLVLQYRQKNHRYQRDRFLFQPENLPYPQQYR